jgi:hypothetical protein
MKIVELNHKAGQNPPKVVAPIEEVNEDSQKIDNFLNISAASSVCKSQLPKNYSFCQLFSKNLMRRNIFKDELF